MRSFAQEKNSQQDVQNKTAACHSEARNLNYHTAALLIIFFHPVIQQNKPDATIHARVFNLTRDDHGNFLWQICNRKADTGQTQYHNTARKIGKYRNTVSKIGIYRLC